MIDEIYFWHADKNQTLLKVDFIILVMYNQTCSKHPKQVFISLQYLQKSMSYEIDFLPADKHNIFLQIDSFTLRVHGQVYPKHPKQQLYDIFAISQGKHKGWS